jgi:CO/xanthine dehydrogenase Mo-binding subunit
MDRHEVFQATGPTPGSNIKIKLGTTNDGKLVAAYAYLAYEAGGFAGSPVGAAGMCVFACYDIPNVQIDGYDILCNKPKSSAYRAPGATNAALGTETLIDEICEKLGIDPLEFRKNNGAKEGVSRADGPTYDRIGYIETVDAAMAHEHYSAPLGDAPEGRVRGRGVASGFWMNFGGQSAVNINLNGDGTVTLVEGSTDIGGTRASIAMQAAEVLHLKAEEVRPIVVDTETIGYTDVTGGSRTTFGTGLAAIEAARDVLRQMKERAAKMLEVEAEDIEYSDKVFSSKSDSEKKHTFEEVAEKTGQTGGPVVGRATTSPPSHGPAMATHIVDIELDIETGKIDVIRYTAIQDAGKAIHPSYVEGQMQGGVVQGIGWALSEEYVYDDEGHLLNSSFLDYRMMTTLDLPMIDTVIVEVPAKDHPYGVRGVGEVPIVPPPAAIANALYRAAGVRMEKLPMSPKNVLEAMGTI